MLRTNSIELIFGHLHFSPKTFLKI